jgi:ADP-ribosylglycohydrolase
MDDHAKRTQLARLSLNGLSIGDAFGTMLQLHPECVACRKTPAPSWYFTDDTVMGIAVTRSLELNGFIDQDELARRFAQEYSLDPHRGYGHGAHQILTDISQGFPWREAASKVFRGSGSMGNGAAMRVGPLGAWFYDDLEKSAEQADLSAQVTHAHIEGRAGAIAVSVASSLATKWFLEKSTEANGRNLIESLLPFVPESQTRDVIVRASALSPATLPMDAVKQIGCGEQVLSQDTVPFCLWVTQRYLTDFEEALWTTASVFGDVDTNCAIVGSIVSCAVGAKRIPIDWLLSREPLNG